VIGLAYLSTACQAGSNFGIVQHVNEALDHVVLAHELGHILGASHTTEGVMGASLGETPPTSFSTVSQSEIGDYVRGHLACFDLGSAATPTPAPNPTPKTGAPTPTATPTTAPGATPRATPGATNTPTTGGGGGGIGGGGGAYAPLPSLAGDVTSSGVSGTLSLSSLEQGCVVEFRAATSGSKVGSGRVITRFTPSSRVIRFSARFTRRLRVQHSDDPRRVYVGAVSSCPNRFSSLSQKLRINATRVSAKVEVPFSKWVSSLRGALSTEAQ
jgi:hypothetical protein